MLSSNSLLRRPPAWAGLFVWLADLNHRSDRHALSYDTWSGERHVQGKRRHTALPASFKVGSHATKAITLRSSAPLKLVCLQGALWITQDRDSADYALGTGQSLEIEGGRAIVVFAMQDGLLEVALATPSTTHSAATSAPCQARLS